MNLENNIINLNGKRCYIKNGLELEVVNDCFCEGYLHEITNYPREGLEEKKLKKGDIVTVEKKWSNFYGTYIRVKKEGGNYSYDITTNNLKLKE